MKIDLGGRRALVTGGNSGLGAGTVRALAACGADVAIGYLRAPDAAETMVAELTGLGGGRRAMAVEVDISEPAQVAAAFARIKSEWGGLDILVNNAGIDGRPALGWDADGDAWRKVVDVNLVGSFNCAREALKLMVPEGKGVILNMTSVHEIIAWTGYSAYCASKAGLSMLSKTLAQEAGPHGIRVVAIAPGAMKTEINQAVWSKPEGLADLMTKVPLGHMGTAEDVGNLAAFLASDLAGYITGTTVLVDGGMTDYANFMQGG